MPLEEALQKLLDAHAKKSAIEAHVIGTAINITDSTCDVEIEGEATMLDVRLHCIEDELKRKFVVKPKDGSSVIVGIIHNLKTERFIVQCSEIEDVLIKIDEVEFNVNSTGVLIKNGEDSLREVFEMIIEATSQISVVIGNNADFEKLIKASEKLKKILR